MSDFSRLELLVDSNKAVNSLNNVQQQLNKTESAANSLQNTLKKIGLGIGLTALFKESLKLSNSFDALNKRVTQFFGSSANKAIKDLTNNFTLADRAARELLTTAGKFGSATGFGGERLTKFSSDLTKLAADVAAFHAIDDVNSVLERFGLATLGRTQSLREFGVQIDTTSQKFRDQVMAIQLATGATEAQAKQMAILEESQRQLAYTQGSAAQQINSGWQQLNNLFTNFKDILSKVGDVFSTVFAPILKMLNDILQVPFVKTISAWGIAFGALLIPLEGIAKAMKSAASSFDKATDAIKDFGTSFQGTIKKNYHEALKFENVLKRLNREIRNQQNLRVNRKILKAQGATEDQIANITSKLKEGGIVNKTLITELDTIAGKLLKTDLSTIHMTASMKNMFYEIDTMLSNYSRSSVNAKPGMKNLQLLLAQLGITSVATGDKVDKLNTSLKTSSIEVGGLINVFNTIKEGFDAFANINLGIGLTGVLTTFKSLMSAFAGALISVGKILAPIIVAFVSLRDIWIELFGTISLGEQKIQEEADNFRKKIIDAQDPSIFYEFENHYESWLARFSIAMQQTFLDIINWLNKQVNKMLGTNLKTDYKTDYTVYRELVEARLVAEHLNKFGKQYVNDVQQLNFELEKLWTDEVEDKRALLEKEIKMHADTYNKLQKRVVELRDEGDKVIDEINKDISKAWMLGPKLEKLRREEINARKLLNETLIKGKNATKQYLDSFPKKGSVDRDIVKSIMSPVQTAVSAVSADSVEAIRLQSRQVQDDKEVKLIEVAQEGNEISRKQLEVVNSFKNKFAEDVKSRKLKNNNDIEVVYA